jgi:UrcA family protein
MKLRTISLILAAALAGAGGVSLATPTSAQTTVEELTVTGRYGPAPESARTLSQTVSYADLDLSTEFGRRELDHRIKLTARYLCDKLGESASGDALAPSCRDGAVRDAKERVGTIEGHFAPRGTTWVAGPAWDAPYPAEWVKTYP